MPISRSVHSLLFTPEVDAKVVVTVTYDVEVVTGSDWGPEVRSRCYVHQDSVTTYGDSLRASTTRQSQTNRYVFDVEADLEVECGLHADMSGAVVGEWNNIAITAEVIKR